VAARLDLLPEGVGTADLGDVGVAVCGVGAFDLAFANFIFSLYSLVKSWSCSELMLLHTYVLTRSRRHL